MNKQIVEEANTLVPALRDDQNIVVVEDPFFSLKSTLFSFFENMLLKVQAEDDFMKAVKSALLEKIHTGEISVSQLMTLLGSLNHDKLSLVDAMLSIFKPTPGTGEISPLINPKVTATGEGIPAFQDLKSEERELLDKLRRISEEASTVE